MYHTHTQVYMYVRDSARGELTRVEGHGLPTESKKGTFSLSYFFFCRENDATLGVAE